MIEVEGKRFSSVSLLFIPKHHSRHHHPASIIYNIASLLGLDTRYSLFRIDRASLRTLEDSYWPLGIWTGPGTDSTSSATEPFTMPTTDLSPGLTRSLFDDVFGRFSLEDIIRIDSPRPPQTCRQVVRPETMKLYYVGQMVWVLDVDYPLEGSETDPYLCVSIYFIMRSR